MVRVALRWQIAFPCSIVPSRYPGAYEGGRWLAFPARWLGPIRRRLHFGDDITCHSWFHHNDDKPIGRGDAPGNAYADLLDRLGALSPETISEWRGEKTLGWQIPWRDLGR